MGWRRGGSLVSLAAFFVFLASLVLTSAPVVVLASNSDESFVPSSWGTKGKGAGHNSAPREAPVQVIAPHLRGPVSGGSSSAKSGVRKDGGSGNVLHKSIVSSNGRPERKRGGAAMQPSPLNPSAMYAHKCLGPHGDGSSMLVGNKGSYHSPTLIRSSVRDLNCHALESSRLRNDPEIRLTSLTHDLSLL